MKKIILILVVSIFVISLSGCNRQIIDTVYSFDEAVVRLPDDTVIRGKVDSWKDFSDGDQIQVKIDGDTYLVHSSDIVLIHK